MFNEKRILEALMERSGVYADIYIDERAYTLIQLESGRVEKLERGEDAGVGLRVITPWKSYYASTNSFDESHLADLAGQLSRYGGDRAEGAAGIAGGEQESAYPFSIGSDPGGVAVEPHHAGPGHVPRHPPEREDRDHLRRNKERQPHAGRSHGASRRAGRRRDADLL